MTSSYKPPTFENIKPQSMIKTVMTVVKVQHHKLQTLELDKDQLLSIDKEILIKIHPDLPILAAPHDNRRIEEIISAHFDKIMEELLESFLILFETEASTHEDFEKAKISFVKRLGNAKFLGEENSRSIIEDWIYIANVSLGIEKVVCNYEAEYFTPQHPHYWRKGIKTVKGREDPLSVFIPVL